MPARADNGPAVSQEQWFGIATAAAVLASMAALTIIVNAVSQGGASSWPGQDGWTAPSLASDGNARLPSAAAIATPSPSASPAPGEATNSPAAAPAATTTTATPSPTATAEPAEEVASDETPTPGPLAGIRIWSDGDSVSYWMTTTLFEMAGALGAVPVRAPDYKISSGLVNRGYSYVLQVPFSDWYSYIQSEIATYQPDVMVFLVGANDLGYGDLEDYRTRAGTVMDLMEGRRVAWVGIPNVPSDRAGIFNGIFAEEAAKRPWVTFVDVSWIAPDASDGYHFSGPAAARVVAEAVMTAMFPGLPAP
jgi:hypothetical protein